MKKLGKKHSSAIETISAYCSCVTCPIGCRCKGELIIYADASYEWEQIYYEDFNYSYGM